MSREAAARIRDAIGDHGPITFAEFMEHALYGPGGFYEMPPIGAQGHFVTSPHVHPVFARLVGIGLEVLHGMLGRPEPFPIVEVGAGDGTLARELLAGFARAAVPVAYAAVEVSRGAREALSRLPVHVCERLRDVGPLDGAVVLANELLDNLPFRRVRATPAGPAEVRVGLDRDRLVEVLVPVEPDLAALVASGGSGEEALVPVGALAFVDELASVLTRGYAVLIDYGSEAGPGGPAHGYRRHTLVEDLLTDPGDSDITAGLDLGVLAQRAAERGLVTFPPVRQAEALGALGYHDWARDALDRQVEMLAAGRGAEAARTWSSRSRASLLVDPAGLGRLRWLLLATPGLEEPGWLRAARALEPRPGSSRRPQVI